jgi:glycosyltransferase involved in cell wall biosynthesis
MSIGDRLLTEREPQATPSRAAAPAQVRVLFLVEGFTDIRFVVGLSQISKLTMVVPAREYRQSHLIDRVTESGASVRVIEIPGGRLRYQVQSLRALRRLAGECDLILVQELLRGALNANLVGRLMRVPVLAYMCSSPIEYFRCRRERREIGPVTSWIGNTFIRGLVTLNGRLSTRCLALGPYLMDVAGKWKADTEIGRYYGVDVSLFRPATQDERARLRERLNLPRDKFLVVFASRISHEKDPETVLRAVALARGRGLDAVVLNLGGGYQKFLALPSRLGLSDAAGWTIGREAVHPMKDLADYLRTADVVAQASLAEGAGYAPLEALACGTPVVATAVGGMALLLRGYAQLTPRQDAGAMASAILAVAADPASARAQAQAGRDYVCREWNRDKAFADLAIALASVAKRRVIDSS